MKAQKGFTLIEIAIVLVIIGLLLGGVLKGQELITSARVRNLISQQDGIKAAFFGFQDRYRALPGDYIAATTNINCTVTCYNGDGDGSIIATGSNTAANGTTKEHLSSWHHLSAAGFLSGSFSMPDNNPAGPSDRIVPRNPYGVFIELIFNNNFGDGVTVPANRHNLKTGNQIPVEIMAEVDRKIDDGLPSTGSFQFSPFAAAGTPPVAGGGCIDGTLVAPVNNWNILTPSSNCGATSVF